MIRILKISAFALAMLGTGLSMAQDLSLKHSQLNFHHKKPSPHPHQGAVIQAPSTVAPWMSSEVGDAWSQGYRGQGTTITVLDQFRGLASEKFSGNLNGTVQNQLHGEWTSMQAKMIAPLATLQRLDIAYSSVNFIPLRPGLNVINYSAGVVGAPGQSFDQLAANYSELRPLVNAASKGAAVVTYATGNFAAPTTATLTYEGQQYIDYTSKYLRGTPSAIFVGALSSNGSVSNPAALAPYSSFPGTDTVVQKQSLVVGVDASKNGNLEGTSFAAPIIAGYSAILGSKFVRATPTQVANQLLNTARKDTIAGYDVTLHGRGEASITRALAPSSIR